MPDRHVVIRAGCALLGTDLEPVRDVAIRLDGASIAEVGQAGRVDLPRDAEVIDAGDLTLAPGFIDAHVHIGFFDPSEVVDGGVTTARDLAWPPGLIFPLAERSEAADFDGPTILAAGPMLTVPDGYPTRATWAPPDTGLPLTNEDDARGAVDRVAGRGAAVIKVALDPHVGPTLPSELVVAIVEAAHAHDLKVTAHIYGLDELSKAVAAGVDELAHMLMSTEEIPDDLIETMVSRDIAIVPTLSVRSGDDLQVAIDNLRRFRIAGGRVVYGTDLGNEGPSPGIDRREVNALSAAGMAPLEIVRAATTEAAAWLGLADVGTLATGMSADLVGFAGEPIEDADALVEPALVIRRGRMVRRPGP